MHIQKSLNRLHAFGVLRLNTEGSSQRRGKGSLLESMMRDSQSIGMVNEMPSLQGERSYFRRATEMDASDDESLRLQQGYELVSPSDKLQRIESQLSDIEKMKIVFENKRKADSHAHSTDKKWVNRSVEKHNLKPCNMPKVVAGTSEFAGSRTSDFREEEQQDRFSFEMGRPEIAPTKQQQQNRGKESTEQEGQRVRIQKKHKDNTVYCNAQSNLPKKCECSNLVQDFMSEVRQKMSALNTRVTEMEQNNANLRVRQEKVLSSNMKSMAQIQRLAQQRRQLIETEQKWRGGKVELQRLLKQVLFKKQREKVLKQNMSIEDCENYFKGRDKSTRESAKESKDRRPLQVKQSGKNKVENLLQRLQLRVERS